MKDLLNQPHFHAPNYPFMSIHDRAAQFMPFKSLTGYHDQVEHKESEILDDEWQHVEYEEDYLDF